jgi:hypothetical protein
MAKRPILESFAAHGRAESESNRAAIARLFGELPAWLPESVNEAIDNALAVMKSAGQSPDRIFGVVRRAQRDAVFIPATALEPADFIKSAYYLAHVQQALRLGKARALRKLSGPDAELGNRTRTQRQAFSAKGNAERTKRARSNDDKWTAIGRPLREKHPFWSDAQLAREISRRSNGAHSTVRAALKRLGLSKSC